MTEEYHTLKDSFPFYRKYFISLFMIVVLIITTIIIVSMNESFYWMYIIVFFTSISIFNDFHTEKKDQTKQEKELFRGIIYNLYIALFLFILTLIMFGFFSEELFDLREEIGWYVVSGVSVYFAISIAIYLANRVIRKREQQTKRTDNTHSIYS